MGVAKTTNRRVLSELSNWQIWWREEKRKKPRKCERRKEYEWVLKRQGWNNLCRWA
jgi:hypothetical protein